MSYIASLQLERIQVILALLWNKQVNAFLVSGRYMVHDTDEAHKSVKGLIATSSASGSLSTQPPSSHMRWKKCGAKSTDTLRDRIVETPLTSFDHFDSQNLKWTEKAFLS